VVSVDMAFVTFGVNSHPISSSRSAKITCISFPVFHFRTLSGGQAASRGFYIFDSGELLWLRLPPALR
jgi:hypothetical protein